MTEKSSQPVHPLPSSCAEIRKCHYDDVLQDLSFLQHTYLWQRGNKRCLTCSGRNRSTTDEPIFCFEEGHMLLCRICARCFRKEHKRAKKTNSELVHSRFRRYICPFCNCTDIPVQKAISHILYVHMKPYYRKKQRLVCPCKTCPNATADAALTGPEMRRHIWTNHMISILSNYQSVEQVVQMLIEKRDAKKAMKKTMLLWLPYFKPFDKQQVAQSLKIDLIEMSKPKFCASCFGANGRKNIICGDVSQEELRWNALQGFDTNEDYQLKQRHYIEVHEELIARPDPLVAFAEAKQDAKVLRALESMALDEIVAFFLAAFQTKIEWKKNKR